MLKNHAFQNKIKSESQSSQTKITLQIPDDLIQSYPDVYTKEALAALQALSIFNKPQKGFMEKRMRVRQERAKAKQKITFLDPNTNIPGTDILVQDARDGRFVNSEIPHDLRRQWIQGTGPAARPKKPNMTEEEHLLDSLRSIAFALLSGADGWMFDGEDAAGQIARMSLETQRNLKLAIDKDPRFMKVAEQVAKEMNEWSQKTLGKDIVPDWKKQLDFTTKIFRPRGLHLDDRHIRDEDGNSFSASIVDVVLYVTNNYKKLIEKNSSIVLYLPKIQTAEEAALWKEKLSALEEHLGLEDGTIKTYVLVEQLELTFQLMETRAALGENFVGFNTGRWDYINNTADSMAWDESFIHPNITDVTLKYGYMKHYEERVLRAVNTPDAKGQYVLWQGGMEPNIPVGSEAGIAAGMARAVAGAEREQQKGASGKWVSHWKMVHYIRGVWEKIGQDNQLGKEVPRLTYTAEDAAKLTELEEASRTIRGARDLISVALQYGNAFLQGHQAAALKPADYFDNPDVLFLMEDAATGEIRLSILWEWLHKGAMVLDETTGEKILFTRAVFDKLLAEEYDKLLRASDKNVFAHSKTTSLPIAKEIVNTYVTDAVKAPWYIDLLNINLNNSDLGVAKERIGKYMTAFKDEGVRITENLDTAKQRSAVGNRK